MPWLRRTFRIWRFTIYRDGGGAFYLRFANGKLWRLGSGKSIEVS